MPEPITVAAPNDELEEDARVRSMGTRTLEAQVLEVAKLRAFEATFKKVLAEHEADFLARIADVKGKYDETKVEREAAEHVLRALAVERYGKTKEKQVTPGVTIKMMTVIKYEPVDAVEWARKNDMGRKVLSLAKAKFEAIARNAELPFVQKDTQPKATIATDLEAALR